MGYKCELNNTNGVVVMTITDVVKNNTITCEFTKDLEKDLFSTHGIKAIDFFKVQLSNVLSDCLQKDQNLALGLGCTKRHNPNLEFVFETVVTVL